MKAVGVFVLFLFGFSTAAKLPSQFKKCYRRDSNFDQCMNTAIEDAVMKLKTPVRELGLPSLHPLEIPALEIAAGQGAAAITQKYKNLKVSGFEGIKCHKTFVNFEAREVTINCTIPESVMEFDYEMSGKILLLPIFGNGQGRITLKNLHETVIFSYEEHTRKNVIYANIKKVDLDMNPELITFDLQNLFNGDKMLSENILNVMNENWREIFVDVKSSYEEAFGMIFSSIFNHILAKVSLEEIFGPK